MPPDTFTDAPKTDVTRARLRDLISHYHLRPGAQLSISKLSESLKVSPTPIREALAHLHGEGLVTWNPNRGYFVPEITADEMVSLAQLLLVLVESSMRGLFGLQQFQLARTDKEPSLEIADPFIDSLVDDLKPTEPELYVENTDRFLRRLLSSQCNEQLLRTFDTISYRTRFIRAIELIDASFGPTIVSSTQEMIDAVRRRDIAGAIDCLTRLTTARVQRMERTVELALIKTHLNRSPRGGGGF
ncbi:MULTISPECIES: GntR family transcriptional regulator [unclassified Bradyrhizobium]|uniref:GntR family transcriptional regulator n=1 Tax=unclassified Bradyrhizobium TaxID=2631580 RepID=UPI002916A4C1|nr:MULTISPECIES: GntR family transcriptional regulator [unclassified Bradyrhizobium]